MSEITVIIPSRLEAKRLPEKPMLKINNKEMILHVYEAAKQAELGEVYVASPDDKIIQIINQHGGKAVKTNNNHQTGTDRVFEVFDSYLKRKPKIVINLQGDMPNINPGSIVHLANHMKKNVCDVATLASNFQTSFERKDINIVKVKVEKKIKNGDFSKALDFFREENNNDSEKIYHHIGIYAFTNKALLRYVSLKRSSNEIKKNLEQIRALDNNMKIDVGFVKDMPLSVDTEKDLKQIRKLME